MSQGTFFGEDVFSGPKHIRIRATVKTMAGSQMLLEGFDFAANSITAGMSVTGPGVPEGTTVTSVVNGVVHLSKSLNNTGVGHLSICTSGELPGAGTEVVFDMPRGAVGVYDEITPEFWLARKPSGSALFNAKVETTDKDFSPYGTLWANSSNNPTQEISIANAANLKFDMYGDTGASHSDLGLNIVYLPLEDKILEVNITRWDQCWDGSSSDMAGFALVRTTPVPYTQAPSALPLLLASTTWEVAYIEATDEIHCSCTAELAYPIDLSDLYPFTISVGSTVLPFEINEPITNAISYQGPSSGMQPDYAYPSLSIVDKNGVYHRALTETGAYTGWMHLIRVHYIATKNGDGTATVNCTLDIGYPVSNWTPYLGAKLKLGSSEVTLNAPWNSQSFNIELQFAAWLDTMDWNYVRIEALGLPYSYKLLDPIGTPKYTLTKVGW